MPAPFDWWRMLQQRGQPRPEMPQRVDLTGLGTQQRPMQQGPMQPSPFTMPPPAPLGMSPMSPAPPGLPFPAGGNLIPQLAMAAGQPQMQQAQQVDQFGQMLQMLGQLQGISGGQGMGPAPAVPSNQQGGLGNMGLAQILGSAGAAIAEPGTWQARLGAAGAQTAGNLQQRQDTIAQQARQEQMDKARFGLDQQQNARAQVTLAAALQEQYKPIEQQVAEAEALSLAKNPWLKVSRGQTAIPLTEAASAITGNQAVMGQPGYQGRGGASSFFVDQAGNPYTQEQAQTMIQAGTVPPGGLQKMGTDRPEADPWKAVAGGFVNPQTQEEKPFEKIKPPTPEKILSDDEGYKYSFKDGQTTQITKPDGAPLQGAISKSKKYQFFANGGVADAQTGQWLQKPAPPNREPSDTTVQQMYYKRMIDAVEKAVAPLGKSGLAMKNGVPGLNFADPKEQDAFRSFLLDMNVPLYMKAAENHENYIPRTVSYDEWKAIEAAAQASLEPEPASAPATSTPASTEPGYLDQVGSWLKSQFRPPAKNSKAPSWR